MDHYEINVAKDGTHYFATATRSGQYWTAEKARAVFADIKARFPESEGFDVSITRYEITGRGLNW